jgi:hypothetical protein
LDEGEAEKEEEDAARAALARTVLLLLLHLTLGCLDGSSGSGSGSGDSGGGCSAGAISSGNGSTAAAEKRRLLRLLPKLGVTGWRELEGPGNEGAAGGAALAALYSLQLGCGPEPPTDGVALVKVTGPGERAAQCASCVAARPPVACGRVLNAVTALSARQPAPTHSLCPGAVRLG